MRSESGTFCGLSCCRLEARMRRAVPALGESGVVGV
jgi:hypothetical protein